MEQELLTKHKKMSSNELLLVGGSTVVIAAVLMGVATAYRELSTVSITLIENSWLTTVLV